MALPTDREAAEFAQREICSRRAATGWDGPSPSRRHETAEGDRGRTGEEERTTVFDRFGGVRPKVSPPVRPWPRARRLWGFPRWTGESSAPVAEVVDGGVAASTVTVPDMPMPPGAPWILQ